MDNRKTWLYHKTQKPRLVSLTDTKTLEQLEAEGWKDTPAAFKEATNKKDDEGSQPQASEMTEVQKALLETFVHDPDSLDKDELMNLGNGLGLKLMKAWKEPTLVNKIQEHLTNGNDQAAG